MTECVQEDNNATSWIKNASPKILDDQKKRLELFEKQKRKGAIIDLKEEKDRYLLGDQVRFE